MKARFVSLTAIIVLFVLTAGCADRVPDIRLAEGVQRPVPGAVVFFVDGMDGPVMKRLQSEGKLPNITKYFIEGGVCVEHAAASLPTITYANNVSFNTALFPGHHGITGNKWFDRYSLTYRDYTYIATYRSVNTDLVLPTLFEMLPDEFTASISTPVKRGATRAVDNWMSMGVAWYFKMNKTVNQLAALRLELLGHLSNDLGRWPRVIVTYFPTSDTIGHARGPDSPEYLDNLADIDHKIGQFIEALRRAGLLDTTYLVLVTDHGLVSTPRANTFPVHEFLGRRLGIDVRWQYMSGEPELEKRVAHYGSARVVVVTGGDRCSRLHLRAGDSWFLRPTPEEIDGFARAFARRDRLPADLARQVEQKTFPQLLAEQPGVDLVAVREGEGVVRILDRQGAGRITRQNLPEGKSYRYEVLAGNDPLGQDRCPATAGLMDGQSHPSRRWLEAGVESDRPDVVPQLPEMFDSPRSGDVVLFAADGWEFVRECLGGHGGLLGHEILVPFYFAGPGLPAGGVVPCARTVDLTPTILGLLGKGDSFATLGAPDGIDLSARLRAAALPATAPSAVRQPLETQEAKP